MTVTIDDLISFAKSQSRKYTGVISEGVAFGDWQLLAVYRNYDDELGRTLDVQFSNLKSNTKIALRIRRENNE